MNNITISDSDLRDLIEVKKETQSGQYICDCPFCGKSMHFYIDKRTQLFECKKCWESGNIYKLLKYLGKTYLLQGKSVKKTDVLESIRMQLEEKIENSINVEELPEIKMPIGFRIYKDSEYLRSRHITRGDCNKYKLGYSDILPKYENYVLIPIYDNLKIRGFLGRYSSKIVPKSKLRYNNSLGTDFASLLFGYDDIVKGETETVILVEGVFDKINVDKYLELYLDNSIRCVCTFGKKISNIQIQKLLLKQVRNIIVSYDYDALREIKKFGLRLKQYFNTFACVCMLEKDLGDCNNIEVKKVFSDPISIDNFVFDVIGKIKR